MAVVFGAAMQKGGAGKSTTCVNLAAALADHGRTLLLDLDQQKTLATYYHIKPVPQPNLYHAMMSRAELADLVQPSPDGFDMILADEDIRTCGVPKRIWRAAACAVTP
jgi:chromosome partitioning protein